MSRPHRQAVLVRSSDIEHLGFFHPVGKLGQRMVVFMSPGDVDSSRVERLGVIIVHQFFL
ncbi:hypothetical protein Hamer_G015333 [Homarus americanus]|uniref:Uncharacterized protein n=1 Tax=Homarus americanus TaxID=6706 RepID=A0A8J5TQK0_HOMAM|nr:hypothetical protein Hamer_G015333 [Homarus americanus]